MTAAPRPLPPPGLQPFSLRTRQPWAEKQAEVVALTDEQKEFMDQVCLLLVVLVAVVGLAGLLLMCVDVSSGGRVGWLVVASVHAWVADGCWVLAAAPLSWGLHAHSN